MLPAALLLLACGAEPTAALSSTFVGDPPLTLATAENGPPPGSSYPPPPPLVQDPPMVMPAGPEGPPPIQESYPPPAPQQSYAPPTPPEIYPLPRVAPPPVADVGLRTLLGIGAQVALSNDDFNESGTASGPPPAPASPGSFAASSGGGGLGLYLRLGAQVDDRWGVEGELSLGTVIVDSYLRGALTIDYTPVDWFTLALGPTARNDWDVVSCGCGNTTINLQSIGGTVRFDFHLAASRTASGRNAFTIGLVGDLGATLDASGFCGNEVFSGAGLSSAFYLTFGYTHY